MQLVVQETTNALRRCFKRRRAGDGFAQPETALEHVAKIEPGQIVGHDAPGNSPHRAGRSFESILPTAIAGFCRTFSQVLSPPTMHSRLLFAIWLVPAIIVAQQPAPSTTLRPITFLDRQLQRSVNSPTISPDGRWLLYVLSTPDWSHAKSQSDIYLVSIRDGLPSTRQLTFTSDKNETSPRWSRDGKFFVFLSNRDAASEPSAGGSASGSQNQVYVMRPDGGEARKITDAKEGVSTLAFSKDGKWLAYRGGKANEEQLYALPVSGIDSAKPTELTHQQAAVGLWKWSPDSRRIYFVTADTLDKDEQLRMEKKFNVAIRNMMTPLSSLWALDVDSKKATRLTRDTSISVTDFNISDDGKWIGFHGTAANRYMRNITEQNIYSDLYL